MLKLYFGNLVNTVTTLLLVVLLGFLGVSLCHRAAITGWGRRTLLALVLRRRTGRAGQDHSERHRRQLRPWTVLPHQHPHPGRLCGRLSHPAGRCGHPLYPLPIHAGGLVLRPICRGAAEGGHGGGVSIFGVTPLQVNDRLL